MVNEANTILYLQKKIDQINNRILYEETDLDKIDELLERDEALKRALKVIQGEKLEV